MKIRTIVLFILIILTVVIPIGMIIGGFVLDLSWWSRLAMVCCGLLLAWLIKPVSILTGKDLKII